MINLPRAHIDKIYIFDSSTEKMTVNVETHIKDAIDRTWSASAISEHMKYLVVISANADLNSTITQGLVSFDKDILISQYSDDDEVSIFSGPIDISNPLDDASEETIVFSNSFTSEFDKGSFDVRVFCSVYLDMSEIYQKSNLQYQGSSRKRSDVSSDTVIYLGKPQYEASVFTFEDGRQYNGPVHFHESSGFMVGPRHTSEPHEKLVETTVANLKLKDFRSKNYIFSNTRKDDLTVKYSDLNYSVSTKGHTTGIFSINFKNILLNHTKYGSFIAMLSDDAILKNINSIKIKTFQIMRKRIDVDESYIVVKSFSRAAGQSLEQIETDKSSCAEITAGRESIRMFYFTDKDINKNTLGKYKYKVSLSFSDPTVSFISDILDNLNSTRSDLNEYCNMLKKNKNYDYHLNRTRPRFYQSQYANFDINDLGGLAWARANEIVARVSSYLYDLTEEQRRDLIFSNSAKIDPRSATVFSVQNFIQDYDNLNNTFRRIFDLSNNETQSDSRQAFVKTANSKNVIFLEHLFKNAYVPKNYFFSYDYSGISTGDGISILKTDFFKQRVDSEFNKFFSRAPSDTEISQVPDKYKILYNLQDNSYSYLSPVAMTLDAEQMTINDISKIEIKKINQIFNPYVKKNIYNFGFIKKTDIEDVIEEMSKPDIKKNKES